MSDGGWLYELGQYRDLVMHSAPINLASYPLYAIQEFTVLPEAQEIKSIRLPQPANPSKLHSERSKRTNFDKYIYQFKELARLSLESRGKYNCLEYAHEILVMISSLSFCK